MRRAHYRSLEGMARGQVLENEYSFVQMADTQLGMMKHMADQWWLSSLRRIISALSFGLLDWPLCPEYDSSLCPEEVDELEKKMCRAAVEQINKLRPRPAFAIVCGDLVNAYPLDAEQQKIQIKDFKDITAKICKDIALVCVCGNHDLGERPNALTLAKWEEEFGDDYFTFWVGDDKFIVINSQLYKNPQDAKEAAAKQDEWLKKELDACTKKGKEPRNTIVFSHIPPFCYHPEEDSGYFPLDKAVRGKLLRRMATAGVSHWFCGHYHRNCGGFFVHNGKRLEVITTAAVGGNITTNPNGDRLSLSGMKSIELTSKSSGFRIVNVCKRGISHEFRSIADMKELI